MEAAAAQLDVMRTEPAMLRRTLFVVGYAIVHWWLSLIAVLAAYGATMQGFDGGPAASSVRRTVTSALADVLYFPLSLVAKWLPVSGLIGHVWVVVNGLIWGVVLLTGFECARRAWKVRRAAA